jgi:tetratricopeptide (TPR) repeat protein
MTSYNDELTRTRRDIELLQAKVRGDGRDLTERVRLAFRQYHLATLTECDADFVPLQGTLTSLIQDFGPQEDVCLLKANVAGRFHRMDQVTAALELCPRLAGRPSGRAILADVDFQLGRYEQSAATLRALLQENGSWDVMARLAHWHGKMGDPEEADRLYYEAEEELTAKEVRSFMWLELQRGDLAMARGRLEGARAHYARADASFPGHWRTDEHRAALLVAEGKLGGAESLLRDVVGRTPKAELKQALGGLLIDSGRREWLLEAESVFLASVQEGGVHYLHHLADLYADGLNRPAEAVRWARRDLALRSNFATQSALAWALFRDREYAEGLRWIGAALASGVRDPDVFAIASALLSAVADGARAPGFQHADGVARSHSHAYHPHH